MLAGRVDTRYLETAPQGASTVINDVRDHITQPVPVLEVALGLAYERGPWELAVGYELQTWFNLADRVVFVDDIATSHSTNDTSDLMLDGMFLRLSFVH